MKLKITYKELSIILGIMVAIMVIFTWLSIQQEPSAHASELGLPNLNIGIKSIYTPLQKSIQSGLHFLIY